MLKKTILLTAVLVFALAPVAQAQVTFATGFEDPPYVAGYDNLVPQDGWATQFGGLWHVQPYVTGSIPWTPQSSGGIPPVSFYTPPVNPTGGEQYVGKGTDLAGGNGGGRAWHAAAQNGLVQVRTDFCNGSEHDYPNYQNSIVSRGNWSGSGPGNMVGIYTSVSSTYVEPPPVVQPDPVPDPPLPPNPRQGNWAFAVMAFDEFGNQIAGTLGPFYRFDGVAGFDELPRETWWRIGYTFDTVTRKVTEFYSEDIVGGTTWTITNPQAMWDIPGDDPDVGPQLVDMYLAGGATGTDIPDAVGIYNVGNGQIAMYDNIEVSIVPEPATMGLLLFGGLGVLARRRRRS